MKKTTVLLILDGFGLGKRESTNPIYVVNGEHFRYIKQKYAIGALQAGGIAVGLPWGEVGNSEVGHLTIGAGRVMYQHYPRITLAIRDGSFFANPAFLKAAEHAKKNRSAFHIAGLLTEGNIHASFEHLEALVKLAREQGLTKIYLHLFADGKDSHPKSAANLLGRVRTMLDDQGVGMLATYIGRHFALDRDGHWDRTEAAYRAMTAATPSAQGLEAVLAANYERGNTDEHLPATIFGPQAHPISENDSLIFIDFREDSIRQLASAFILPDFDKFKTVGFKNVLVATMTDYAKKFTVPVAFPNEDVGSPLGKVLADAGKTQLLIAETEKYAHVTYFFNGYRDEPFSGQSRVLIPSRNVERHDEHPEMMAEEIASRILEAIEDRSFDLIVANFANPDMIAHTGNFDAAVKAIQVIDVQVGRIVKACEVRDASLVITSDHGNAEKMSDSIGGVETSHDSNPVPLYVIGREFIREKSEVEIARQEHEVVGILSDVAPTILGLMGVAQPPEMTGKNLLRYL